MLRKTFLSTLVLSLQLSVPAQAAFFGKKDPDEERQERLPGGNPFDPRWSYCGEAVAQRSISEIDAGQPKNLNDRHNWGARIALIARDRGCDDCAAPISLTEAHHPHEWEHGGHTDIDNLELKCHRCHANEHRGERRPPTAA